MMAIAFAMVAAFEYIPFLAKLKNRKPNKFDKSLEVVLKSLVFYICIIVMFGGLVVFGYQVLYWLNLGTWKPLTFAVILPEKAIVEQKDVHGRHTTNLGL